MRLPYLMITIVLFFGGCMYSAIEIGVINKARLEKARQSMLEAQGADAP